MTLQVVGFKIYYGDGTATWTGANVTGYSNQTVVSSGGASSGEWGTNNVSFSPTINNRMDWEEFVFGVQRALQEVGS